MLVDAIVEEARLVIGEQVMAITKPVMFVTRRPCMHTQSFTSLL